MVPDTLVNFFLASTGAGAALVGLVFVAISLASPEVTKAENAPQWRAVAGNAFLALFDAFLVSLNALNSGLNLGWSLLTLGLIGLSNSVLLGLPLLKRAKDRKRELPRIIANRLMILASIIIYGMEGYFGVRLLLAPYDTSAVEGVTIVLAFIYCLGLLRAWELMGIEQVGVRRWLNPLQHLAPPTTQPDEPTSSSHDTVEK